MPRLAVLALVGLFTLFLAFPAHSAEILVAAAASLTESLKEIAKAYESKSPNRVSFNFGSSNNLAWQIDEGAPADLFFSADLEKMDRLEKRGRIEASSRRNLLSNQLVIIAPLSSPIRVRSPEDLLLPQVKRIALAEPGSVPAGIYAKRYLEGERVWDKVRHKIVPVLDVRAALAAVESGNVDMGIVYKTDAAIASGAKIIYEVPKDKGPRIVYPVALVKGSRRKEAARDFLKFVLSPPGKETFKKYGFIVLY